jgi:hypothetical protein
MEIHNLEEIITYREKLKEAAWASGSAPDIDQEAALRFGISKYRLIKAMERKADPFRKFCGRLRAGGVPHAAFTALTGKSRSCFYTYPEAYPPITSEQIEAATALLASLNLTFSPHPRAILISSTQKAWLTWEEAAKFFFDAEHFLATHAEEIRGRWYPAKKVDIK